MNTTIPERPVLTVTAKRQALNEREDFWNGHVTESSFGFQTRAWVIPQNFDASSVKVSSFANGVLHVVAPRKAGVPEQAVKTISW